MQKLSLLGLLSEKTEIFNYLQSEEALELVERDGQETVSGADQLYDQHITRLNQTQTRLQNMIGGLTKRFPDSKPKTDDLLVDEADFVAVGDRAETLLLKLQRYEDLLAKEGTLKASREQAVNRKKLLLPWVGVDFNLKAKAGKSCYIFPGSLPANKMEGLLEELQALVPATDIFRLRKAEDIPDCQDDLLLVVGLKADRNVIANQLKLSEFDFLPVDQIGTNPATSVKLLDEEISGIDQELDQLSDDLKELAAYQRDFMLVYDFYRALEQRYLAQGKTASTHYTFCLSAWLPVADSERIINFLNQNFTVSMQLDDIEKGESFPVALKNPPLIRDYEVILELFGAPGKEDLDPTPVMAVFDFCFFGMMLSDVGYGLMLSLICAYMLFVKKIRGEGNRMARMLMVSGVSSVLWGFVFGGFFGNLLQTVSQDRIRLQPLWFDPMDDPMKLLLWCMLFGAIHLFFGMGMKAYNAFKLGSWQVAVFDIIPWYFIICGLGMLALPQLAAVGKYMALVGAAVVLLFAGREAKNPIMRLFKGLLGLYDITSYISDILSYSRILALVLATSVIAMVFNLIGFMPGPPWGYLTLLVIGSIGHVVNLLLSALSAYVHSSRLQYVEFFGKFFEAGGRYFKPLAYRTGYVQVKRREDKTFLLDK